MEKSIKVIAYLSTILMLFFIFSPTLASSSQLTLGPRQHDDLQSSWSSTNWSGYAVSGSAGSVTSVQGSWIVPAVSGGKRTTAYSSFWVGIDGFNSNTVEQIGTDSDLRNGIAVYYAWYEFYPNPMVQITSITISPGDTMSASVTFNQGSNTFTVQITDVTAGQSVSQTGSVSGATESSAEWIAEAPSSRSGVLPLANFVTVNFGTDYTAVSSTCFATVNGVSGSIGSFGSAVQTITMVGATRHSTYLKAQPSTLSTDGTSFSVTWYHA